MLVIKIDDFLQIPTAFNPILMLQMRQTLPLACGKILTHRGFQVQNVVRVALRETVEHMCVVNVPGDVSFDGVTGRRVYGAA